MALGALKLARFSTLNTYARNCRVSCPRSCMSFRNERGPGCSACPCPDFQKGQCRLVANPKVVKRTIVDVFLLIKVRALHMTTTTQGGCSARTPFYLIS